MSETSKAFARRFREGWFLRYTQNRGLDIGCGDNPVTDEVEKWDIKLGHGDATHMQGVPDNDYWYVYSYHLLEHLADPVTALRNWYRILQPSGWLIVGVPHRDLYEKRTLLPSVFNGDHKWFWLPIYGEAPHTRGLLDTAIEALGKSIKVHWLRICDEGYDARGQDEQAAGEYTIELIIKK